MLYEVITVYRRDTDGRESLLYYLTSGQVCSMALTCCSEGIKANINVEAETEADIIRIPVQNLDEWMVKYPTWKIFVMHSRITSYNVCYTKLLRAFF